MDESQYDEVFDTWTRQSRYQQRVVETLEEYFKENSSLANNIQRVMSIGAGEGDLDVPILTRCLPCANYYCGIEPRTSALTKWRGNLSTFGPKDRVIEIEFHEESVEDFDLPGRPVDLIIVGHVMYYVKEEMQTLIEKFTTWLNPAGVILMSHSAPNDLFCEIGSIFKEGINYREFHDTYRRNMDQLKANGVRVEDHRVKDLYIDFSEPATQNAIILLTNESMINSEDLESAKQLISSYSETECMRVPYEIMLTLIFKD